MIAVDWSVSLAFEDSVRLAEEVKFMLHSTALPESCLPPPLVRGWFDDAMAILGRAYGRPCIHSFLMRYFVDIIVYATPIPDWTT
jgi:hypothetical protein